jgi:SPP1 family predicted phage head-tail adaptor
MGMNISAGRLRHRVVIKRKVQVQNPSSGEVTFTWIAITPKKLACEIVPLSGKEYLAAESTQSKVIARAAMRYRTDVDATCRMEHTVGGVTRYYQIEAVLPDLDSGLGWMTLPLSQGVNDGR